MTKIIKLKNTDDPDSEAKYDEIKIDTGLFVMKIDCNDVEAIKWLWQAQIVSMSNFSSFLLRKPYYNDFISVSKVKKLK